MGTTIYPTVPVAQPAAEPWPPLSNTGDDHTIRVDEMFARQLDNEFSAGVRGLLHDPETGVAAQRGEAALEAIAGAMPALGELKERTLAQAIDPRQRSILESLIETRLDWAAGTLGRLAQRATVEVDDASVSERVAGLKQDAAAAWHDPAHLRKLGRTAVEELRYQGERRGWDPAETDRRVRAGLSDLYAGAVETAIRQDDLDGASALYGHAREVIDPERQATLDRRFVQAREDSLLRDVDRALTAPPLDPAGPPDAKTIAARAAELMPDDAHEEVRVRIGQVAEAAYRRLDRQWNKQQPEAGVAALEWLRQEPYTPVVLLPQDVRDWLAPDQRSALEALEIVGHLETDGDLFERLDRLLVYEPDRFATLDLDRHRLSLDDEDHGRFASAQKVIAEGRLDPGHVRYDWLRRGIDRTLKTQGIDTDGPAAAKVRADARDQLASFEAIEGRAPVGSDLDDIARRAVDAVIAHRGVAPTVEPPPGSLEELDASSAASLPAGETPVPPDASEVTRFDDGTRLITRRAVETERGKADVSEAYDEHDRIASVTATFGDGHRVESRWSYPGETHWSQVDTVRGPEGETLGTITTTFDGERVTRVAEPTDGPPQTDIWDRDVPVATAQNVAAPLLAIPFLLDLTAAAIGAVIVGKAIDDTISRPGASGTFGGSEMARPTARKPGKGHNNPPEPVEDDKRPPSGPPVPPGYEIGEKSRRQGNGSHEIEPAPTGDREFQKRKSGQSGKEAATNIPDWARQMGARPYVGETPDDGATRIMNQKYGENNWEKGPSGEFSRIKKHFSRAFEDPKN